MKQMKKDMNAILPNNINTRIAYSSKKLGACFKIKDDTKHVHKHDLVYKISCPEPTCQQEYIGETGRRLFERVKDHNGRDKHSLVHKHAVEFNHKEVDLQQIEILGLNYGNKFRRKIAEALFITECRPTLNIQEKSVPLKLLN